MPLPRGVVLVPPGANRQRRWPLAGGGGRVREVFDAGADASGEGRRDGEGKNGSSEGRRIGPLNVPLSRLYRDVYGAPDSSLEGGSQGTGGLLSGVRHFIFPFIPSCLTVHVSGLLDCTA